MAYDFDIFLSYRRASPENPSPVQDWVKNHFFPKLQQWLPQALGRPATVFIDFDRIETGTNWPLALQKGIKHSRCLLSVWSPDYFWSKWCVAEWESMRQREQAVGRRSLHDPRGLVFPVIFSDGVSFPPTADQTMGRKFHGLNYPEPVFAQTPKYVEFVQAVQDLTNDLVPLIDDAPAWCADWPVIDFPEVYQRPATALKRL